MESMVPSCQGMQLCICDGFKGAMAHRGTNSLRLIGEAGTPCLQKRNDVCSLQKGNSPVLCKKSECVLSPKHLLSNCGQVGLEMVHFVSYPSRWVSDMGYRLAAAAQGCLSTCLSSVVPTKDRTEQEGAQTGRG